MAKSRARSAGNSKRKRRGGELELGESLRRATEASLDPARRRQDEYDEDEDEDDDDPLGGDEYESDEEREYREAEDDVERDVRHGRQPSGRS